MEGRKDGWRGERMDGDRMDEKENERTRKKPVTKWRWANSFSELKDTSDPLFFVHN